jgi:transposase
VLRGRDVEEVVELKRQGLSIRAISRLTGYDRTTISKYLSAPAPSNTTPGRRMRSCPLPKSERITLRGRSRIRSLGLDESQRA